MSQKLMSDFPVGRLVRLSMLFAGGYLLVNLGLIWAEAPLTEGVRKALAVNGGAVLAWIGKGRS